MNLALVSPGVEISVDGAHKFHPPLLRHQLHGQRNHRLPPSSIKECLLKVIESAAGGACFENKMI
jgi:hypothetical protein